MTRLHLPHAIVVRLHVCKISVVTITLQTADTVGVFFSSNLSLSVGFSTQVEAMDVARFAPQGAHNNAGVIYLLP